MAEQDHIASRDQSHADGVKLDTSGEVSLIGLADAHQLPDHRPEHYWREWTDLDAFTQGYIEALFASVRVPDRANLKHHGVYMHDGHGSVRAVAFSDLAPETLARIIADCAREPRRDLTRFATSDAAQRHERQLGAEAWRRSSLTPYLGDDGRVYLREAA